MAQTLASFHAWADFLEEERQQRKFKILSSSQQKHMQVKGLGFRVQGLGLRV